MGKYRIIIPQDMMIQPERFELSAANILLGHFRADIEFIPVSSSKTPDIRISNVLWEIKSPEGNGKNNLKHQLFRAMKQSKNIVIDSRRSKMDVRNIRRFLIKEGKNARTLRRLLFITKEGKVEVIK
jgi:hypothetical protein